MDNEIKEQIQINIYNLLLITNEYLNIKEDDYNPPFLWASKKYSINKTTPISLMVTNSRILYPMLLACNSDLLEADQKLKIKILAESMYNYFETYYDFENHLYKFQYGMNFNYDGIWLPFNQQNAFGLVLIELYKLTTKVKYKDRLTEIAKKFKFEFFYAKDGRLLWKYWPEIYHNGWNIKSDISVNWKEKHETIDTLYEDISHAGLNLKFILEFHKLDNTIFSNDDLCKINTTVYNTPQN